jgi:alpha-2-macroglobulin-like protein
MTTLYLFLLLKSLLSPELPAPMPPKSLLQTKEIALPDSSILPLLSRKLEQARAHFRPEKCYIHTDRTLLEPGDTLWFCAYLPDAGDLHPTRTSDVVYADLLDPKGSILAHKTILALDGTAPGEFIFPKEYPGGLYKIRAYSNWMRNTARYGAPAASLAGTQTGTTPEKAPTTFFEREITLQKTVLPKLNLSLEFERKALGPGDEAVARFDAFDLENQPIASQKARFVVQIDGVEAVRGKASTDENGRAYIRFKLPAALKSGDGLLDVEIEHKGRSEAIARAVPITLQTVALQFFPEGGDAVAGLPCRMAFKAVDKFGKPADVEGVVTDSAGRTITTFSSYHHGMGAFDFVPEHGVFYTARLSKPVAADYPLPAALPSGMVLHLAEHGADSLKFAVAGKGRPGGLFFIGKARDSIFFYKELYWKDSTEKIAIPIAGLPPGIAHFTLLNENMVAQAERLVFVNRDRGLRVDLQFDKKQYRPREAVHLDIGVYDAEGQPVSGAFSVAVADETLLTHADDKQGNILAALLLEQDVRGRVEEPNFYFDAREPKSRQALDYLLMTQAWRRFVWKEVLEGKMPKMEYAAQRADVSGVILDKFGHPKPGETILLRGANRTSTSDSAGRFLFKKIDLTGDSPKYLSTDRMLKLLYFYSDSFLLSPYYTLSDTPGFYTVDTVAGLTGLVKGKVTDISSGEPMPGVTIYDSENSTGTITDADGNYTLRNVGRNTIRATYVGYETVTTKPIPVRPGYTHYVDFHLGVRDNVLEEVIVSAQAFDRSSQSVSFSVASYKEEPGRRKKKASALRNKTSHSKPVATVSKKATPDPNPLKLSRRYKTPPAGTEADNPPTASRKRGLFARLFRRASPPTALPTPPLKPAWHESNLPKSQMPHLLQFVRAREFYAPDYSAPGAQPGQIRSDFRPVLYWKPNIRTDKNGRASVSFYTSDALTNFRATLEGIAHTGLPAHATQKMFVQKPVGIEMKAPTQVMEGDTLKLRILLTNNTLYPVSGGFNIEAPPHFEAFAAAAENVVLAAAEIRVVERAYAVHLPATDAVQNGIKLFFEGDEVMADALELEIPVVKRGFPVEKVMGFFAQNAAFDVKLSDPVPGSLSLSINGYPSPLEDVLKSLDRMLRQPSGCFEQVSSSNYPNLLVLDLLRQTGRANPETEKRARALLADGYKRLTGYECKSGGFDWFGNDPGNTWLTAYGILQFTDMKSVFPVDQKIIDRSVQWLRKILNYPYAPDYTKKDIFRAYIAWAVSAAGYARLFKNEIETALNQAEQSGNPYQIALLANALGIQKDPRGKVLLDTLTSKQQADGSWTGAKHSVTGSTGQCLKIETTALAVLAYLQHNQLDGPAQKGLDFLVKSKTPYGYGSTQSTVLALKALTEYAKKGQARQGDGLLEVRINGKVVEEVPYTAASAIPITIKNLERFITTDSARVEVFFKDTAHYFPIDAELKYRSRRADDAPACPLAFKTTWAANTPIAVGSTVRLNAELRNTTDQTLAAPMVMVGIPAGLSLQNWQLKQLTEQKICDYYELWEGYAVFHFQSLLPGETKIVPLDLRADFSGTFEAPASQAFLYYANDQRVWSKPERVTVR